MPERKGTGDKASPKIIAVCGKGGVGKTSISAMMTKILMERDSGRILAIDADPAVGLATSLGLPVCKTVDDIRNDLIRDVQSGLPGGYRDTLNRLDYDVLEALSEERNLAFLAIGRPETEGCYCQVNDLLKEIIGGLSQNFDVVIIDGEAGIEQVNRRVMEAVTHLILVSDASQKGIHVCRTIQRVAASVVSYQQAGLIVNRVREEDAAPLTGLSPLNPIGAIPESEQVRRYDIEGRSLLSLPDGAALQAVRRCMQHIGLLEF
jgi:CO dehydrogenase maturation factor